MTAELCGVVERLRDPSGTPSLADLTLLERYDGKPGGVGADERVLVARKGLKPETFVRCPGRIVRYLRKCQLEYRVSTGSTGPELAALAQAGNRIAFDTLIEWKERFLKRLIHQTFRSRTLSREDKEDVLQIARQAFCEEVFRFDSRRGTRIETFAAFGVRRALLKKRRDLAAWGQRVSEEGTAVDETSASSSPSAEVGYGILHAENRTDARALITRANLSPTETKVIELRYFRSWRPSEIAREGHFSAAYVAKVHGAALKKLRTAAAF